MKYFVSYGDYVLEETESDSYEEAEELIPVIIKQWWDDHPTMEHEYSVVESSIRS